MNVSILGLIAFVRDNGSPEEVFLVESQVPPKVESIVHLKGWCS